MEQNRPIKELLQVMLDNQGNFSFGLCHWCERLFWNEKITLPERNTLRTYIKNNRPWISYFGVSAYYWSPFKIEPRIKWINKHIKKLSK
jgi:hypothetical protein